MARPREFELEQVAEGLLNTFWLRGYAGTSIADLTAATNLLPGSLYAAFGNKEAMFLVAVDRYASHMGTELSSDARGLEGVQTLLDTIVRLTAGDPERRGCLIINAIPEAASFSEDTQRHVQRGLRALHRFVRKQFLDAQEDSELTETCDIDALAAVVFSAVVGIRVLGRAGQTRRELQAVADGAMLVTRQRFQKE